MKRQKARTLSIGSISSGTMRSEDLIPAFISAVEDLRLSKADRATVNKIRSRSERADEDDAYWTDEASSFDVEALFDLLGNYCPDYCHFGSTEGDGCEYGVWPSIESAQEDMPSIDDTSKLADLPKDQSHALHVNDHGNCTLYRRAGTRWIEVWAVV